MQTNIKKYNDTITFTKRCLLLSKRNPDTLFASILLPVLMMVLFASLFGRLIHVGDISYVNYIIPGILLQCIGQGASVTAIMLNRDITGGAANRFSTLPVKRLSILWGYIVEAVIRNVVTSVLVLLAALLLGFRPSLHPADLGAVFLLLLGSILALSWLAAVVGTVAGSAEGASALSALVIVLPYISSGFVPAETLPKAMRIFAEYQPMTPIIDTMRSALLGEAVDGRTFAAALAWCAGAAAVFSFMALRRFQKRLAAR